MLTAAALAASLLASQDAETFRIETLHPGVHAALVVPSPPDYTFANSLLIAGDSAVMIVDTQQSPGAAEALLRILPSLTDQPVRWIVNTHWHADHVFGNQVWKDAYPDARIIGHRSLLEDVPERARAYRDELLEALPREIEEREGWLADGEVAGRPLTEEDRAAVERGLALRRRYLGQLTDLRVLPPDVVVDDTLTVDLGGLTVRMEHVGPSHTRGDMIVQVPEGGVTAVGDLLEWGTPWLDGACVPGWVDALGRVRGMARGVDEPRLLPSHGPVVGLGFLVLYEELLSAVVEGRDLEPFRSRLESVGVGVAGFDGFAQAAGAPGAGAGADGGVPDENPRARDPCGGL